MSDSGLPWATSWELCRAADEAVDPAAMAVTISFQAGRVAGRAPVNRYFARCEDLGHGRLRIGPVGMTLMAGPPAALAGEAAYLRLLEEVHGYRCRDELVLAAADGSELLAFLPAQRP